ncbi:MAG: ADP-ribosylglycohydrolase family protein [bacterium]|nr:ADP-ribosylglycohydrolase family protein [bacterium]
MRKSIDLSSRIPGALFGHAIGDALGVPVEFMTRSQLDQDAVTDFRAFGTHNQPPGTWSDDTSLMLCTVDALCEGPGIERIANKFIRWLRHAEWTAHGDVFDVGNSTYEAIARLEAGERPDLAGGIEESSNGNGSLMRILPMGFALREEGSEFKRTESFVISALTHGHPRSKFACWFFVEIIVEICRLKSIEESVDIAHGRISNWVDEHHGQESEWHHYRSCKSTIKQRDRQTIQSSGYVVHSMEASLWCLLNSSNYSDAVLKAVNLGDDSDTTGAITGGLAGALYGFEGIPEDWTKNLARANEIRELADLYSRKLLEAGPQRKQAHT